MLSSLYIVLVYVAILVMGVAAPFVLTLGYVWVDLFRPSDVILPYFRVAPFSLLMGAAAVGIYASRDRRAPPRVGAGIILTLLLALWVTLTTSWAMVPNEAWIKWDWAFKSILFSAFIPFVIRSRIQIEAFILVFVFSIALQFVWGVKALAGGGGYGQGLGMSAGFFLGNGEILSGLCLVCVVFILYVWRHGLVLPSHPIVRMGFILLIVLAIATVIGTYSRTGLVALAVFGAILWYTSRQKVLYAALCAVAGLMIVSFAPAEWTDRMATIFASVEERDSSASSRIAMWTWTIEFASANPFGGGFSVWQGQQIPVGVDPVTGAARLTTMAFHSSYFEVLGEHGWIGLFLFLALIFVSFRSLHQVRRFCRGQPQLLWAYDLAGTFAVALTVIMACGVFTEMAMQPPFYYLFALSLSLREYVRRLQDPSLLPDPSGQVATHAAFPPGGGQSRAG